MNVWVAKYGNHWDGMYVLDVCVDEAVAKRICDEHHGAPLDWSNPTLGVYDESDDVRNAEGFAPWCHGDYSIGRYEVKT